MQTELLSRMILSLIREVDEVSVPHLGTFYAELMPASFSDQGFTINPPYRRLSFRSAVGEDHSLLDCYCRVNNVDGIAAMDRISTLADNILKELEEFRNVEFPGLGRLRITKDGTVFFVPDPELDIFPDGIGLASVSLRTHAPKVVLELDSLEDPAPQAAVEPTLEAIVDPAPEVITSPAPLVSTDSAPEVTAVPAQEATMEPAPQEVSEREAQVEVTPEIQKEKKPSRGKKPVKIILKTLLVLLVLALVALAAFLLAVRFAPDFVDSILYTPEELLIINS